MATTHNWINGDSGYIYDASDYVDGTAFNSGDTLVVTDGEVTAAAVQSGQVASLSTGTYILNSNSAGVTLGLGNISLNTTSLLNLYGSSGISWDGQEQFVNYGLVQVGNSQTSTSVIYDVRDGNQAGSITNAGTFTIQGNTIFDYDREQTKDGNFANLAGGVFNVEDGATFTKLGDQPTLPGASNTFANNGVVNVLGSQGSTTLFDPQSAYNGAGTLNVTGAPGETPVDTAAILQADTSGIFGVASGQLQFETGYGLGPSATINLLDSNAVIFDDISEVGGNEGAPQTGSPLQATINGFTAGDQIDFQITYPFVESTPQATESYNSSTHVLTLQLDAQQTVNLTFDGTFTQSDFVLTSTGGAEGEFDLTTTSTANALPCYCPGTLIMAEQGEIAVEHLSIGSRVVTASGSLEPIRWIGRRSYTPRFAAGDRDLWPVCITAGALADGVPRRDLWVSPLHAMYLDGVLIPAGQLVNGTTIVQSVPNGPLHYIHIELAEHNVIWAEGAAAETFIDDMGRGMFHNGAEYRVLYGDEPSCAPAYYASRLDQGHQVEAVRRRIAQRSLARAAA